MRDKVYIVLAFLGLAVLVTVYVLNQDPSKEDKEFGMLNYYTGTESTSSRQDSAQLYKQMVGDRSLQCPVVTPEKTITASAIGDTAQLIYKVKFGIFDSDTIITRNAGNWYTNEASKTVGPVSFRELLGSFDVVEEQPSTTPSAESGEQQQQQDTSSKYIPIIAPFNYTFDNNNTDTVGEDGIKIVIHSTTSTGYTVQITFTNCANWYCAGKPGSTSFEGHNDKHMSIIGCSRNAVLKGGTAKDIIGYGTLDTKVLVEINGVPSSINHLFTNTDNNNVPGMEDDPESDDD